MADFNIVAAVQAQATNIGQVARQIQRELGNINARVSLNVDSGSLSRISNLNAQVGNLRRNLGQVTASLNSAAGSVGRLGGAFGNAQRNTNNFSGSLANSARSLQNITNATRGASSAMDQFAHISGLSLRRFLAFAAAAGAVSQLARAVHAGVGEALLFQREMVRIAQVSGDTKTQIGGLEKTISRLSTSLGVSSKDLASSAVIFRQAGISIKEVSTSLETLAQAALAPNFDSMSQTAEGMIAIMRQFNTNANETREAIGAMNAVAGEFAVEASDLISAVRKAGGAFKQTGGNLNEFMALFTAVRSTTREGAEEIATGLRTIFTRLQRNQTVESLKELQINLRYTREEAEKAGNMGLANQFVGAYEAVRRLSQGLQGLRATDPRYAQVIEQLGGYRQISRVIPLITQFGEAQRALNVAQAGGISLTIANEKAQDALLVRLSQVKETYLELFRAVVNSDGFKSAADGFASLATGAAAALNALRPLIPLMIAFGAIKLGRNLSSAAASGTGGIFRSFTQGLVQPSIAERLAPRGHADGGLIPGSGNGDTVPAMLTPGEFVMTKAATQRIGVSTLRGMMNGAIRGYNTGDVVEREDAFTRTARSVKEKGLDKLAEQKFLENQRILGGVLSDEKIRPGTARHDEATSIGQTAMLHAINKLVSTGKVTGAESEIHKNELGEVTGSLKGHATYVAEAIIQALRDEIKKQTGRLSKDDIAKNKDSASGRSYEQVAADKEAQVAKDIETRRLRDIEEEKARKSRKNLDAIKPARAVPLETSEVRYTKAHPNAQHDIPSAIIAAQEAAKDEAERGDVYKPRAGRISGPNAKRKPVLPEAAPIITSSSDQAIEQAAVIAAARTKRSESGVLSRMRGKTPAIVSVSAPSPASVEMAAHVSPPVESPVVKPVAAKQTRVRKKKVPPASPPEVPVVASQDGGTGRPPLLLTHDPRASALMKYTGGPGLTTYDIQEQYQLKALYGGNTAASVREQEHAREEALALHHVRSRDSSLEADRIRAERQAHRILNAQRTDPLAISFAHSRERRERAYVNRASRPMPEVHGPFPASAWPPSQFPQADISNVFALHPTTSLPAIHRYARPHFVPETTDPHALEQSRVFEYQNGVLADVERQRRAVEAQAADVAHRRLRAERAASQVVTDPLLDPNRAARRRMTAEAVRAGRGAVNSWTTAAHIPVPFAPTPQEELLAEQDRMILRGQIEHKQRVRAANRQVTDPLAAKAAIVNAINAHSNLTARARAITPAVPGMSSTSGTSTSHASFLDRWDAEEQIRQAYHMHSGSLSAGDQELLRHKINRLDLLDGSDARVSGERSVSRFQRLKNAASRRISGAFGISRQAVTNLGGRAANFAGSYAAPIIASYAGEGLASAAGSAENAVAGRSEGSYRALKGAGNVLTTATLGASVGFALGGPMGAAIGGVTAGLYGLVTSLKESAREIQDVKINNALTEFSDRLNELSTNGVAGNASSVHGALSLIKTRDSASTEKNRDEATSFFSGFNNDTFLSLQQRSQRHDYGSQLPQISNALSKQAEGLGRANVGVDLKKLSTELREGGNGLNKELLAIIAGIRGVSINKVIDEFAKSIEAGQKAVKAEAEQVKARAATESVSNSFQRLTHAVSSAADVFHSLQSSASSISDLFHGTISPNKVNLHGDNLNQLGRNDAGALVPLRSIANITGDRSLLTRGEGVDSVARILPGILDKAVTSGVGGEDVSTMVEGELKKQLGNGVDVSSIITTISHELSHLGEKVYQEMRIDPSKLMDKLLEPVVSPLKEAGTQNIKILEEAANATNAGYAAHSHMQAQTGHTSDFISELQLSSLRSKAANSESPGKALDAITAKQINAPFEERQFRLAGNIGHNPRAIGVRLNEISGEIAKKEKFVNDPKNFGTAAYEGAQIELNNLKTSASQLGQALSHLTDVSKSTAGAQEKLSRLQSDKQSRLGYGAHYFTADTTERNRLARGQALAIDVAKLGGNTSHLSHTKRNELANFLQVSGTSKLVNVPGQPRADEFYRHIIEKTGHGLTDDEKKEEKEHKETIAKGHKEAEKAAEEIRKNQEALSASFFLNLQRNQLAFLNKLATELRRNTLTQATNERTQTYVKQKDLKELVAHRGVLNDAGINNNESLQALTSHKGDIETLLNTKKTIQDQYDLHDTFSKKVNAGDFATTSGIHDVLKEGKENHQPVFEPKTLSEITDKLKSYLVKEGLTDGDDGQANRVVKKFHKNFRENYKGGGSLDKHTVEEREKIAKEALNSALREELAGGKKGTVMGDAIEQRQRATGQNGLGGIEGLNTGKVVADPKAHLDAITAFASKTKDLDTTFETLDEAVIVTNGKLKELSGTIAALGKEIKLDEAAPAAGEVRPIAKAGGGFIPHGTDTVPAMLTPGEFVVSRAAAQANMGLLHEINSGGAAYYADGGNVDGLNYHQRASSERAAAARRADGTGLIQRWDPVSARREKDRKGTYGWHMENLEVRKKASAKRRADAAAEAHVTQVALDSRISTHDAAARSAEVAAAAKKSLEDNEAATAALAKSRLNQRREDNWRLDQAKEKANIKASNKKISVMPKSDFRHGFESSGKVSRDIAERQKRAGEAVKKSHRIKDGDEEREYSEITDPRAIKAWKGVQRERAARGMTTDSPIAVSQLDASLDDRKEAAIHRAEAIANRRKLKIDKRDKAIEKRNDALEKRITKRNDALEKRMTKNDRTIPDDIPTNIVAHRNQAAGVNFIIRQHLSNAVDSGASFGRGQADFGTQNRNFDRNIQTQQAGDDRLIRDNMQYQQHLQGRHTATSPRGRRIPRGTVQNYSGGGVVGYAAGGTVTSKPSQGGAPNTDKLVAAMGRFDDVSHRLTQSFTQFAGNANALAQAITQMPRSITMEGTHNVNVTVNGAEVMAQLMPTIKELVATEAASKLAQLMKNHMPDAGISGQMV